jgi:hypothetical protein
LKNDESLLVRSLMALTVMTDLIDAVSFVGLGHIFTANMTGNVAFLGETHGDRRRSRGASVNKLVEGFWSRRRDSNT